MTSLTGDKTVTSVTFLRLYLCHAFLHTQDFTENVHITTLRAITDYLIRPEDLEGWSSYFVLSV